MDDTQFQRLLDGQDALRSSFSDLASDVRTHGHAIRNLLQIQQLHGVILNGNPVERDSPGIVLRTDRLERSHEAIEGDIVKVRRGAWRMVVGFFGSLGAAGGAWVWAKVIK